MPDGKVVVVGSSVVDLTFLVEALPLPGESAVAGAIRRSLGGKGANQAAAARLLGAPTCFASCVGDDAGGRETAEDLERAGIEARLKVVADAPTGHAAVVVDAEGENQIAVHPGANSLLGPEDVRSLLGDELRTAAVFVAQLEVPPDTVRAAAEIARENEEGITILNAAPVRSDLDRDLFGLFDVAVVNRVEAEQLAEVGVATIEDAKAAARGIGDFGARDVVVTLGAAGAVCTDRGRTVHVPAPQVEVVDATGSGDAFVGALAVFLREGMELVDAVEAACRYAALAVMRAGTRSAYVDREAYEKAGAAES